MTGTAHVLRASAGVWVPTVIGVTVAQTLLVLGDPVPVVSLPFIALTLGSGAAFAIGIWLVSRALFLAASGERAGWREVLRPHPALLWAIAMVVILVLLTLVSPYITVLGIWFGLLVVPAAAGFALATMLLHAVGIALTVIATRFTLPIAARAAGGLTAVAGVVLAARFF